MKGNQMGRRLALIVPACVLLAGGTASSQDAKTANKVQALASIEKRKADLIALSDRIWAYAETALREHKSAKALSDYAEQQGMKVERGIAGMPTAFVASYG